MHVQNFQLPPDKIFKILAEIMVGHRNTLLWQIALQIKYGQGQCMLATVILIHCFSHGLSQIACRFNIDDLYRTKPSISQSYNLLILSAWGSPKFYVL